MPAKKRPIKKTTKKRQVKKPVKRKTVKKVTKKVTPKAPVKCPTCEHKGTEIIMLLLIIITAWVPLNDWNPVIITILAVIIMLLKLK